MKKLFLFAVLVIFASSCATVNLTFNKNPEYHGRVKKIFILLKDIKKTGFVSQLSLDLPAALQENGIDAKAILVDGLTLENEKDFHKMATDFSADAVITVERAFDNIGASKYGNYYSGGFYVVSLTPFGAEKPVWKANIDTDFEYKNPSKISKRATNQLIVELLNADLLSPKVSEKMN